MMKKVASIGLVILLASAATGFFLSKELLPNVNEPLLAFTNLKSGETKKQNLETDTSISAKGVLLKKLNSDQMVARNADQPMAIASLTKMMTVLCLLENVSDSQQQVIIPGDIFSSIEAQNLATAGFLPGEAVLLSDLLYGIMLPSGAEAAISAALFVSGSEAAFVQLMNQKAVEIGLKNTHFVNVTGSDDVNHYSTAEDLAKLLEYALNNEWFYQIFTTFEYQTVPNEFHPEGVYLQSTLLRSGEELNWQDGSILGGKTGYTEAAGQCLASIAELQGEKYLLILLGAKGTPESNQYNIQESRNLYRAFINQKNLAEQEEME